MIQNEPKTVGDQRIDDLRAAYEHRATWMYLLIEEAEKLGLDKDEFARKAIYQCGCLHKDRRPKDASLAEYAQTVFTKVGQDIFEQDVEIGEEEANVVFHYCPLVAAWQKLTDDETLIAELCDIAMDGDRGLFSDPRFDFKLSDTIAKVNKSCVICVKKRDAQ